MKKDCDDYQVSSRTGLVVRLSSLLRTLKSLGLGEFATKRCMKALSNTTKLRKATRFPQRIEVVRVCVS